MTAVDEAVSRPGRHGAPKQYDYLHDPAEIYRRSFELVRTATDLSALPDDIHDVALRLVHAAALPDLVHDLVASPGAAAAGRTALAAGAPVLCDVEMVANGVIRGHLPAANRVICTLNDDGVRASAEAAGTTRSAAAVERWTGDLAGAVVAIGNAPTALFRLLELLSEDAPAPALIVGLPVGFVGAAESKDALIADAGDIPYITLIGRFGGSALAAAAVNALAGQESTA